MSNALYEPDFALDLTRFDEPFRQARIAEETAPVPDGAYEVAIESVDIGQSQAGNVKITWVLRILGPAAVDRVLFKSSGVTENNLHIIKQELHTCGLDLERFSDLPKMKDRMLDVELQVTKRTRNGAASIYFDKRLSTAPRPAGDDDDLPF